VCFSKIQAFAIQTSHDITTVILSSTSYDFQMSFRTCRLRPVCGNQFVSRRLAHSITISNRRTLKKREQRKTQADGFRPPCASKTTDEQKEHVRNTKRTAAGIPTWSPTVVLICRSTAYVWQSGRDAQFSADYGRTYWKCFSNGIYIKTIIKESHVQANKV
jgi:hypothetical protein